MPQWHAPWALHAVASGHLGWVRCVAFDPQNQWFVTGSADRTIKVWDLAKCSAGAQGGLKLTLTGHVGAVRGLAVRFLGLETFDRDLGKRRRQELTSSSSTLFPHSNSAIF